LETKGGKTYEGDHLIVTLPLGVLKSGDVKFEPPLPKSKQAAIDRLGVSYLEKLFLEFEEVFWDPQVDLFNIIQDDWTLIVNVFKLHTRKPVLQLFNYG
jgi:monoamine oxidase